MEPYDIFDCGKREGTGATLHALREYFKAYYIKNYTYDEVIKILDDLEEGFLKTLEKK